MKINFVFSMMTIVILTVVLAGCPAPVVDDDDEKEDPPTFDIERVSLTATGAEGDSPSLEPATSADGRYVAFLSTASNLLPDDNHLVQDAFVRDRQTGALEQVNASAAGVRADADCWDLDLSADGRYVALESPATNLVAGDANGKQDIFVKDRQTGAVDIVSTDASGNQSNNPSWHPAISADGRYVAFESNATNLVAGDTNTAKDVFVKDRQTGAIEMVSMSSGPSGVQGNYSSEHPAISADGRYVAFFSSATNLVTGDDNDVTDVFVFDRQTDTIERVSTNADGIQVDKAAGYPDISADGRYVAFRSSATNLVSGAGTLRYDIYVKDRETGAVERVSVGPDNIAPLYSSEAPAISADGRYMAYQTSSPNLVAGDTNSVTDVFLFDRQTDVIVWSSACPAGTASDDASGNPALSADGKILVFNSVAGNLVTGDDSGWNDVFAVIFP